MKSNSLYSVKAKRHLISYQRPSNTDQEKLEGSRIIRLVENNNI